MNYIKMINQFWQLRRSRRITNLQADLYYFLLQECNGRGWENPFQVPNGLICVGIGITEKSLIDARNVLKQIGLIDFEPGVTKRKSPTYYLLEYWNPVSNPVGNQGGNEVSNPVGNEGNIYNKTKQNSSLSASSGLAVMVAGKSIPYEHFKKNFLEDEGLRLRWVNYGFRHDHFEEGLLAFFQLKHGTEYPEMRQVRLNFYHWIPSYVQELKKRTNEPKSNDAKQRIIHRPAGRGGSIAALQALKSGAGEDANESAGTFRDPDDSGGTDWQEAEIIDPQ